MFGKIDQMSREEVESRLTQLLGNVVEATLENKTDLKDPEDLKDEVEVLDEKDKEDKPTQKESEDMTDLEEEEKFHEGWTEDEEDELLLFGSVTEKDNKVN